jgi:N-acetylglucosamine kinase-like BadF-type ATPase
MIKQYEQNLTISPLGKKFLEKLGYDSIYKLKIFMYTNDKKTIANEAKFLSEQAYSGSEEAQLILRQQGEALAEYINLAFKHLNMNETAGVGFCGSFVLKAYGVKDALINKLDHKSNIIDFDGDPIDGTFYLAVKKGAIC